MRYGHSRKTRPLRPIPDRQLRNDLPASQAREFPAQGLRLRRRKLQSVAAYAKDRAKEIFRRKRWRPNRHSATKQDPMERVGIFRKSQSAFWHANRTVRFARFVTSSRRANSGRPETMRSAPQSLYRFVGRPGPAS